jgi:hypothetical protein
MDPGRPEAVGKKRVDLMPIAASNRHLPRLKPGDRSLIALEHPAIPQTCQAQCHRTNFFAAASPEYSQGATQGPAGTTAECEVERRWEEAGSICPASRVSPTQSKRLDANPREAFFIDFMALQYRRHPAGFSRAAFAE